MRTTRRTERVASLIRNTIGQLLLAKISDPRIDPAKTSVTRVEVPDDLLTAKVYVSVIGTEAEQRTTLRALRHAAGRVQELMMREIRLRHTPLLEFALDEKFKKTLETYRLIQVAMDEIRQKEQQQSGEPVEAEGQNGQEPGNQDSQ
ncbi:MAG TPA: 30S ribosome-binding factor RbfA [Phycisphaerales bacterium]|nr:30S ribosome-binding factor RbfA [Phycisphaerales bacterium]